MLAKELFVPIPGSRKEERIGENLGTADVELTMGELEQIETELARIPVHGKPTKTSPGCIARSRRGLAADKVGFDR
jgi:diketogulonate reductase-like aldo/keto reductase